MKNYFQHVKLFVKRFFLVVIFYQICRGVFYFFNKNAFDIINLKSFLGGLHFDLSAIAYINIFFGILHLVPGNFKNKPLFQKWLKISVHQ